MTKALAFTDVVEITSVLSPYPDADTANPFYSFGPMFRARKPLVVPVGLTLMNKVAIPLTPSSFYSTTAPRSMASQFFGTARYMIPVYIVRSKSDVHIADLVSTQRQNTDRKAGAPL